MWRISVVGALCCVLLLAWIGNAVCGEKERAEACKILSQYMDKFYKLYEGSRRSTKPQAVAELRAEVDHKLLDLGVGGEVFIELARFEFACRSCFYLGVPTDCGRVPGLTSAVLDLAGCVE